MKFILITTEDFDIDMKSWG